MCGRLTRLDTCAADVPQHAAGTPRPPVSKVPRRVLWRRLKPLQLTQRRRWRPLPRIRRQRLIVLQRRRHPVFRGVRHGRAPWPRRRRRRLPVARCLGRWRALLLNVFLQNGTQEDGGDDDASADGDENGLTDVRRTEPHWDGTAWPRRGDSGDTRAGARYELIEG